MGTKTFAALAVAVSTGLLAVTPAGADVWFLGIGNDEFHDDAYGLRGALTGMANPHDVTIHTTLLFDRTGSEILSDIGWLSTHAGPTDTAIFYYSGHGGYKNDSTNEELNGWAEDAVDETIGFGLDWCTDDMLANALGQMPAGVPVIAIFDTCYSGGMTGGTADLNSLDDVFVMMASGELENSYGGSPYSEFTTPLIAGIGAGLPADANNDDAVTLFEWFNYASQSVDPAWQTPEYYDSDNWGALAILPELAWWLLPGDADMDGDVDLDDFVIFKTHYGMTGVGWEQGDFNDSGGVDLDDFVILKTNFGTAVVSEPAAPALLAVGAAAMIRRRRQVANMR